jgi:hypothetical protein
VNNEPEFRVEREGTNVKLSATLISMFHDSDDGIAGTRPEKVSTRLWYTDRWTYSDLTGNNSIVSFSANTRYASAWNDYYDATLQNAGLVKGEDYNITLSSSSLTITIDRVSEFTLSHAFVETFIGRAV